MVDMLKDLQTCILYITRVSSLFYSVQVYTNHYSCVVIILFNTGLYKPALFTYSFGKLVFRIFAFFVFFTCSVWPVSNSMLSSQTL